MNRIDTQSWKKTVPRVNEILQKMQEKTIVALGVAPYPRIVPALFLKDYQIYSVKDTADLDVLRKHATVYCLEERFPKVAPKIHSTSYLLGNYAFQAFLKSRKRPIRLMFYQTTPPIIKKLEEQGLDWIGNRPENFENVVFKKDFRDVVRQLGLPRLEELREAKEVFLSKSFQEMYAHWERPFVVQRGDFDVAGEQGTFFVRNEREWQVMHNILSADERFKEVQVSPFVEGHSTSVLGCITHQGVLTSPLQLQFIDVPEALHNQLPTGVFLGHDWNFKDWPESIEKEAQVAVERVGEFLFKQGFRGIFGIDFIYDTAKKQIFPLECNPRFTGSLPMYSLMIMAQNTVPPMEFFHLMAHLNIQESFDFEKVNKHLKSRLSFAHISLTPKGVFEMKLPLGAGIYSYEPSKKELSYQRPGAFPWELQNEREFLMIDSVPRLGQRVIQNVPRLYKLIFARPVATSSSGVQKDVGTLLYDLSTALRKNQETPSQTPQDQGSEHGQEL